ncbi:MAG: T9SS C-terminal target domain-containing protein, partial [Chitinophagia bacterium]|nr:T9SS C-terminal target domain-containing protein [Chitinophagia bacterium]
MKNVLLIVVCVCFHYWGQAQINLVQNPDFETFTHCPGVYLDGVTYATPWTGLDTAWRAPDWVHAPFGVPEYCNVCHDWGAGGAPHNGYFYHYPRTGNGMMQVQMMCTDGDNYNNARDYLQGHLRYILDGGRTYQVSFYVCGEHGSSFSC